MNRKIKSSNQWHQLSLAMLAGLVLFYTVPVLFAGDDPHSNSVPAEVAKMFSSGNFNHISDIYTTDFIRHHMTDGISMKGIDAMKKYVTDLRQVYPDFHVSLDGYSAAGKNMVMRWTVTGTNSGPLLLQPGHPDSKTLPPTGKNIKVSGVSLLRMEGDKIAEEWIYWNHAAVLTQLGFKIIPPGNAAGK